MTIDITYPADLEIQDTTVFLLIILTLHTTMTNVIILISNVKVVDIFRNPLHGATCGAGNDLF